MNKFSPKKPDAVNHQLRNIKLEVLPDYYDHLANIAKSRKISLKELVRQAVDFAINNIDEVT